KLFLPELGKPVTGGDVAAIEKKAEEVDEEKPPANAIDAAAAGASAGMRLALNVAAMLIAFLAFIALVDHILMQVHEELSLRLIFSWVFAPVAFLMGVVEKDIPHMAELLGTKLVANEFVAYGMFQEISGSLDPRTRVLATYALTGFANFASIGIQIGGIG